LTVRIQPLFGYDLDKEVMVRLAEGVFLLPRFADTTTLRTEIQRITSLAPLRHMMVKGGKAMSAAMSNCGSLGWTSDTNGYRYTAHDPLTAKPWPDMPPLFRELATRSAARAGFANFIPDACLINCYKEKAQMGLHQDRDERDFSQPIVSVSIGADAEFFFGGLKRSDPTEKLLLSDGDVLVWGGEARLRFHGVKSPRVSADSNNYARINLTMRKAG
jgi:DNA oxidative demethylase